MVWLRTSTSATSGTSSITLSRTSVTSRCAAEAVTFGPMSIERSAIATLDDIHRHRTPVAEITPSTLCAARRMRSVSRGSEVSLSCAREFIRICTPIQPTRPA